MLFFFIKEYANLYILHVDIQESAPDVSGEADVCDAGVAPAVASDDGQTAAASTADPPEPHRTTPSLNSTSHPHQVRFTFFVLGLLHDQSLDSASTVQ